MGRTQIQAEVIRDKETREYTFLVDIRATSTYVSLLAEEIEALSLRQGAGKLWPVSATGVVDVDTHFAD